MIWADYSAGDMQSHGTTQESSRAYEILLGLLCRRGVRAVASAVQELRTNIRQLHMGKSQSRPAARAVQQ